VPPNRQMTRRLYGGVRMRARDGSTALGWGLHGNEHLADMRGDRWRRWRWEAHRMHAPEFRPSLAQREGHSTGEICHRKRSGRVTSMDDSDIRGAE
jgi:hypothetical protein